MIGLLPLYCEPRPLQNQGFAKVGKSRSAEGGSPLPVREVAATAILVSSQNFSLKGGGWGNDDFCKALSTKYRMLAFKPALFYTTLTIYI
jgi:hypothetical protein